jgi:hypothetical protein
VFLLQGRSSTRASNQQDWARFPHLTPLPPLQLRGFAALWRGGVIENDDMPSRASPPGPLERRQEDGRRREQRADDDPHDGQRPRRALGAVRPRPHSHDEPQALGT